ncbi:head decoration protein [Burkholderia gladioli]|uniref:head decoration protein n=1 Tax=Burkholderia gladioli TaxID=28095 RepID=UPI0016414B28|nr:head decoration protein [Burkholderia gladioli]
MGNPTYTPLQENWHSGGFIVSLANGHQSIDQGVLTGAVKVLAGTVLGLVASALTAAAAAIGANTGNGTVGAVTLQAAPATMIGVYNVLMTSATAFTVTAPDGQTAAGVVGTPFSGLGVGFTITAGGTPFVANDSFTLTTTNSPGNPNIASSAGASNTGNGTIGSLSVAGYAAKAGVYTVEFDDATHFVVSDPTGAEVGHGTTGVAFKAGGLSFTITAGGTAFVPGDSFAITVTAGSGKYKPFDPANVDGSQVPAGILFATKDVTLADKPCAVVVRLCEVNASELVWPAGMSAAAITAALAQLKALGIVPR